MLDRERLRWVLDAVDRAADGCAEEDMRTEKLDDALSFVEANVEKGASLAEAFRTALAIMEPWRRAGSRDSGRAAYPEMSGDGDAAAV